MTDERALLAALREANPVPDPNALIENPGSTNTGATPQRNHTMPSTQSVIDFEPSASPPKRRRSLAIAAWAAVVVVVAAGAIALLRPGPGEVASPEEVAATFFEAINQNDSDAWWALHSEDAVIFGESLSEETVRQSHQEYFDWRTTTESRFESVECTETGGRDSRTDGLAVSCDYVWRGPIQDRFGVGIEGYMLMAIDNGLIVSLTADSPDFTPMRGFPIQYLNEHHGTEFQDLCGGGPGAFNGGEDCALLYMKNLDAMAEAWEAENG